MATKINKDEQIMTLGDAVREYVRRKFGDHEVGRLVLSHESLRYIIANFTIEWINTHPAQKEKTNAK